MFFSENSRFKNNSSTKTHVSENLIYSVILLNATASLWMLFNLSSKVFLKLN